MLGMRSYPQEYVDACRARVEADVAAYRKLASKSSVRSQIKGFETTFFNNMVLVLELSFVHRLRAVEGKDGNPLNEVRVLADSILSNGGVMGKDKTIKLTPESSVLKYRVGDKIELNEEDFTRISKAFFAEIEEKFSEHR